MARGRSGSTTRREKRSASAGSSTPSRMESSTTPKSFSPTLRGWWRSRRWEGPPIPRGADLRLAPEPFENGVDPALEERGVHEADGRDLESLSARGMLPGGDVPDDFGVLDACGVRCDSPRLEPAEEGVIGRDLVLGHRRARGSGLHRLERAAKR